MLAPPSTTCSVLATFCSAATRLSAAGSCVSTTTAEALLAACAVGARVAARAVVAEGAVAFISAGLLAVSSLWLPLILREVALRTDRVLVIRGAILLIEVGLRTSVLLCEVALRTGRVLVVRGTILLIEVRLRSSALLSQVVRVLVSELGLIAVLIEVGRGAVVEIIRPVIAVNIVRVDVVAIDVVGVDVVPIDIVNVRVVAVVVVVPVYKRIRVGDVGVVVVDNR